MHVLPDVDEVAVDRVVSGFADIHTLRYEEWGAVFRELRRERLAPVEAARRVGTTHSVVGRWYRKLEQPPAPTGGDPLTVDQRRAVLDVVRGRLPLRVLPEAHRWIAVHACRAQGLTRVETALRVRACHATVAAYAGDPGTGAAL